MKSVSFLLSFISIVLILILKPFNAFTQDISGKWNGLLVAPNIELRLVINISKYDDGSISATMDSPDQNAKGMVFSTAAYDEDSGEIVLKIKAMLLSYSGKLIGDKIEGIFKQGNLNVPLNFSREEVQKTVLNRPQEPKEPFPYYSEEIRFPNTQAGISLAGTLTLPSKDGQHPVVVLITGSGAQDRNEEIAGHKPFLVIADYLTRQGIGVLRYDDRGFGKSTGNFASATSKDFATDVTSAVEYLKTRDDISKKNIGLIGHSEGGMIAPMVASDHPDDIAFIALLAGTGTTGAEIILAQQAIIARQMGVDEESIAESQSTNKTLFDIVIANENLSEEALISLLTEQLSTKISDNQYPSGVDKNDFIRDQVTPIASPWYRYFLKYNPADALANTKCPVFALNGEKDVQVPAKQNLTAIEKALNNGGNSNVTTKAYPTLNHLFQESNTGALSEYSKIEQTIAPIVLSDLANWIKQQLK
jgi:pimeloyl-ACP methyl ester carboxylesterase